MDKIKTILAGIDGLEERTKNSGCGIVFQNGQNRAYTLVRELIYQQFPELKESEDERLRKWLSDILDTANWRNDWPYTKQQVINYIEKQKEQAADEKYAGMVVVSQEEWDAAIAEAFKIGRDEGERQRKQKPAEWSKEDEKCIKDIIVCLEYLKKEDTERRWNGDHNVHPERYSVMIDKLKSLRPSWKPSKKQIGALENARYMMSQSEDYYDTVQILDSLINDLKNLL